MATANNALKRLECQLESIDSTLDGLSNAQLNLPMVKGKWTIIQHLAHLGRYHEVFLERIHLMLEEENPFIDRYNSKEDPESIYWMKRPTVEILNELRHNRKEVIKVIESLDEESLNKTGNHVTFGSMNINAWIEFFILHEAHHLYTIFRMKRMILQN